MEKISFGSQICDAQDYQIESFTLAYKYYFWAQKYSIKINDVQLSHSGRVFSLQKIENKDKDPRFADLFRIIENNDTTGYIGTLNLNYLFDNYGNNNNNINVAQDFEESIDLKKYRKKIISVKDINFASTPSNVQAPIRCRKDAFILANEHYKTNCLVYEYKESNEKGELKRHFNLHQVDDKRFIKLYRFHSTDGTKNYIGIPNLQELYNGCSNKS